MSLLPPSPILPLFLPTSTIYVWSTPTCLALIKSFTSTISSVLTTLWSPFYYLPYFTYEEAEALRGEVTCSRSHSLLQGRNGIWTQDVRCQTKPMLKTMTQGQTNPNACAHGTVRPWGGVGTAANWSTLVLCKGGHCCSSPSEGCQVASSDVFKRSWKSRSLCETFWFLNVSN